MISEGTEERRPGHPGGKLGTAYRPSLCVFDRYSQFFGGSVQVGHERTTARREAIEVIGVERGQFRYAPRGNGETKAGTQPTGGRGEPDRFVGVAHGVGRSSQRESRQRPGRQPVSALRGIGVSFWGWASNRVRSASATSGRPVRSASRAWPNRVRRIAGIFAEQPLVIGPRPGPSGWPELELDARTIAVGRGG